jgi:hypothetical protein
MIDHNESQDSAMADAQTDYDQQQYAQLSHAFSDLNHLPTEEVKAQPVRLAPALAGQAADQELAQLPANDSIAKSKRILALVDDYCDNICSDTRTALRKALMQEFEDSGLTMTSQLASSIREAIGIAYHRADHAGSVVRKKYWDDVRARFDAAVQRKEV